MTETAAKLQQLDPLRAARVEALRARFNFRSYGRGVHSDKGEKWYSVSAAAKALKVDRNDIYRAILRPLRLHGRWLAYAGDPLPVRSAIVCRSTGESWESAVACAIALNTSDTRILKRLADGREVCGRKLERGPDWGYGKGRFRETRKAA